MRDDILLGWLISLTFGVVAGIALAAPAYRPNQGAIPVTVSQQLGEDYYPVFAKAVGQGLSGDVTKDEVWLMAWVKRGVEIKDGK